MIAKHYRDVCLFPGVNGAMAVVALTGTVMTVKVGAIKNRNKLARLGFSL